MSEAARTLVAQLDAAGEWPDPGLLEALVAQGHDAIEPLRELVRRDVHGWPAEAPVNHAIDGDLSHGLITYGLQRICHKVY